MNAEEIPLVGRKTGKPMIVDFGAITGILTAVTMFAFVESAFFVNGVIAGLGLDLAVYMQPLDYVVITPYWLVAVAEICLLLIAMTYFPSIFWNQESWFYRQLIRQIDCVDKFYPTERLVRRLCLLFIRWKGYVFWILMLMVVQFAIIKASHPVTTVVMVWSTVAAFGPPILFYWLFTWLFSQIQLSVPVLYKKYILPLLLSLLIAANFFGKFLFATVALNSTAVTRIVLKAEVGEAGAIPYNKVVMGTILFRLTDRLLVLSPKGNFKRSVFVVPLAEVRLIEATQ